MKHFFIIILVIVITVTGIFLPYMPGDYDNFAVGLSFIFQFATFASLLLVPLGIILLVRSIIRKRHNQMAANPLYPGITAGVISVIIILAAALGALATHNRFSALIILGMGILFFLLRRKAKHIIAVPGNMLPYYFIFIPLVVFFTRILFFEKAKHKASGFVIKQSEQLIQDIEAYKQKNGYYPVSLLSTIEDYKPSIAAVPRFFYERNGDAYNLYFEQISDMIGTQEILMYNKLGEQEMTVHNQDLLRIAPGDILRGYHKKADLPQPHWKIFYFD